MNNWWETPSNSDFLSQIVEQTWLGNIVLVYTPQHIPSGFVPALKRELQKRDIKNIERLNLCDCNAQSSFGIEDFIYEHFDLGSNENYVAKNTKDIFENLKNEEIGAILFEGLSLGIKNQFSSFIDSLRRYLLNINTLERPKIICIIDPKCSYYNDINDEVGIKKIMYQNVFDKLDNLLGLRYFLDVNDVKCVGLNSLVISYISIYDYAFTEELSEYQDYFYTDISFLDSYIEKKEWDGISFIPVEKLTDIEIWERWANGILEKKNNQIVYHSAFLKAKGRVEEVNKRVWNAELEIILPLIENLRFLIIENNKVIFPEYYINKKTGSIKSDKYEFEIGELSFLMDTHKIKFVHFSSWEKKEIREFVKLCKDIRNDLSHMRNISITELESFFENYNRVCLFLHN